MKEWCFFNILFHDRGFIPWIPGGQLVVHKPLSSVPVGHDTPWVLQVDIPDLGGWLVSRSSLCRSFLSFYCCSLCSTCCSLLLNRWHSSLVILDRSSLHHSDVYKRLSDYQLVQQSQEHNDSDKYFTIYVFRCIHRSSLRLYAV